MICMIPKLKLGVGDVRFMLTGFSEITLRHGI